MTKKAKVDRKNVYKIKTLMQNFNKANVKVFMQLYFKILPKKLSDIFRIKTIFIKTYYPLMRITATVKSFKWGTKIANCFYVNE